MTDPTSQTVTTTSPSHVPPGSVVVGVDGSEDSHRAVEWAADQAALENRPLVLLHAYHPGSELGMFYAGWYPVVETPEMHAACEEAANATMAKAALWAALARPELHTAHVLATEDPRSALLGLAERAALVVVGSRGHGRVASLLLGSVSAAVAGHAGCPVMVVRPAAERAHVTRVVVGVRFDAHAVPVVEHAFAQASFLGVPLSVVHCYFDTEETNSPPHRAPDRRRDLDGLRAQMAQSVAGLGEKYPDVEVELELTTGLVVDLLAEAAGAAQLVVIGRRTGSRLERPVGSWSTLSIVENAEGTVVVVPEASGSTAPGS